MADRAVRWIVRGHVQGVGFRYYTIRMARGLGLRGTVRNAPDGTVEVEVVGAPDRLRTFRERLRSGPPSAWVERIEETEIEPPGELPDRFDVRY